MAQAQIDNIMQFTEDVSEQFHDTINENAGWVQKAFGKGVKFVTTSDGDWKTKCLGFCIKYNEIVVALAIEDVLNPHMFTETAIPTSKQPDARIFVSKSLNFDFYTGKNCEESEKLLESVAQLSQLPTTPYPPGEEEMSSKGAVVRSKRSKMGDGSVHCPQTPQTPPTHMLQTIQPVQLPDLPGLKKRPIIAPKKRGRKKQNLLKELLIEPASGVSMENPSAVSLDDINVSNLPDLGSIAEMCGITE